MVLRTLLDEHFCRLRVKNFIKCRLDPRPVKSNPTKFRGIGQGSIFDSDSNKKLS